MACGIWSGESKPVLNEFLKPLITELKEILANGIIFNFHHITVEMGNILADSPARSLIKGTHKSD